MSKILEDFDVEEQPSTVLEEKYPNLKVVQSAVKTLQAKEHVCFYTGKCVHTSYGISHVKNMTGSSYN